MPAGPSLYRRHRPRSFADVVGQEHVVRTLANAVEQGNVHHAYLFVGSRGTGKTSMAKILAASLNCVNGPTVSPCGECDSCASIASATSLDVIEMDAASNNSVDDIRDLRESVHFAPVSGGWKVYILDEAHMLSPAAWNAFLKTLEEPPANTVFVLATTEAAKVMDTVVDRCHRFDFTRPTTEQLSSVVTRVADREAIEIAPDAVALLARQATGSYRDALGTLEQLVTYTGARIAREDVLAVLGVADDDLLFGSIEAVATGEAARAWRVASSLADSGRDAGRFLRDLEGHARDVLVVQTLGEVPAQLAMTPERDTRLLEQARSCSAAGIVRLLDLLAGAQRLAGDGSDAQTQLELALVKAASPEVDQTVKALQARIERLESAAAGNGSSASSAASPAAPPASTQAPVMPRAPAAVAEAESRPSSPERAERPEPVAAETPVRAPVAVAPSADLDLAMVQELWPAVIEDLQEHLPAVSAAFSGARPVRCEGRELVVGYPPGTSFQRSKAEDRGSREALAEAFFGLTGVRPQIEYCDTEREPEPVAPSSGEEVLATFKREFDAREIEPSEPESGD